MRSSLAVSVVAHATAFIALMYAPTIQLPEPGKSEYKQAIELNFYSLSGHYNLANLYIKQERLNEALTQLRICMKIKPSNAWVHNNLGVIYQKRNYLEEAEEEFVKALNLEPANKAFESNLYLVRNQLRKKPVRATGPGPTLRS